MGSYNNWRRNLRRQIEDTLVRAVSFAIHVISLPWLMIADWWDSFLSVVWRAQRRAGISDWLLLPWRTFLWLLNEFAGVVRTVWELIINWFPNVRWSYFFQGLFALSTAILVLVPFIGRGSATTSVDAYQRAADKAIKSKDFEAADVYLRALLQRSPNEERYRYDLAVAAESRGELELASRIMAGLAKRDENSGYIPAHLWQAERLMRTAEQDPAAMDAAEAHLLRAVKGRGEWSNRAHATLGTMYLGRQQYKLASDHFERAAQNDPKWWIVLARVHVMLGMRDEGRKEAEKAAEHFGHLEANDLDDHEARLQAATALTFLERFDEAAAMLDKGLKVSSDPRYPAALGSVYLTWSDSLRRSPRATVDDQIVKLLQAFDYDPTNRLLLRRVVLGLRTGGPEGEIARGFVQLALQRERWLDIVNLLLAIESTERGFHDTAQSYLRAAKELNSRAPWMLSELARTYLDYQPNDVPLAMSLLNMGLKSWEQDPDLNAMRGYALVRGGHWFEAVLNLESALKARPDDANVHRLIADVYQKIGRAERAAEHRRRADHLAATRPNKT